MKISLLLGALAFTVVGFVAPSASAATTGAWCIKNQLNGEYLSEQGFRASCLFGERFRFLHGQGGSDVGCIQNIKTGLYVSDVNGWHTKCAAGETWERTDQGAGVFCIVNMLIGKYLSNAFPAHYPTCDIGEKWLLEEH